MDKFFGLWIRSAMFDELIRSGVPKDSVDECMEWALGKDWGSQNIIDAPKVLGNKHPSVPRISEKDNVLDGMYMIGREYLRAKDNGTIQL